MQGTAEEEGRDSQNVQQKLANHTYRRQPSRKRTKPNDPLVEVIWRGFEFNVN